MRTAEEGVTGWGEPLARLRQALAKDEFVLYGQPMRALRDLSAQPMAELLVRLREEEKALQPPGEFLPVFEHYKMMPELDGWVLRHLIKQLTMGELLLSDPGIGLQRAAITGAGNRL